MFGESFWGEHVLKTLLKIRFGNYLWLSIIHLILGWACLAFVKYKLYKCKALT